MSQTPEKLGQKIKEAQERQDRRLFAGSKPTVGSKKTPSGMGNALRAGTDIVSAVAVGGFLGYWIDQWLGTKPFGMIIFFFLGSAAGLLSIYRSQTGQDYKIGFTKTANEKTKTKGKE